VSRTETGFRSSNLLFFFFSGLCALCGLQLCHGVALAKTGAAGGNVFRSRPQRITTGCRWTWYGWRLPRPLSRTVRSQEEHMSFAIDLQLYLAFRCTAACRMCNVGSSPERDEEMDLGDARRYLEDVLRLGEIENFILTGGEALLRADEVCELAQFTGSLGIRTRISTNAFWGPTEESASNLLKRLKRAGVVHLWISTDAFHAEFVPAATVKNVLRAAMQERMPFYVQSTYLFPDTDLFGAQGVYEGPVRNDYDRQTKAIQEEISAMCPPGSYGWGRVIFEGRGVSLRDSLGQDLARCEQQLVPALESIPNYDGRVTDRLVITVLPDRTIKVNRKHIGRVSEDGVDAVVREWCSQNGVAL